MINIGDRLRALRDAKMLSQGDLEKRTGLLRCYISRVENGHTIPAIETLEKMARALGVPMYHLFYDGEKPPEASSIAALGSRNDEWGTRGKNARLLRKLQGLLGKMDERDRKIVLALAQRVARQNRGC